jgi:hypothetical protein
LVTDPGSLRIEEERLMTRPSFLTGAGAAVAVGLLVLGLSALPVGSQVVPADPLALDGTIVCNGYHVDRYNIEYVWAVNYTATNNYLPQPGPADVPAAIGDIEIISADVTLDGEAIGPAEFSPNPVPAGDTASAYIKALPGTATGNLELTVTWTAPTVEDGGVESITAYLDGTCGVPAETTTTTQAPAVKADAVAGAPAFTG